MLNKNTQTILPHRILYTMIRVGELERSVEFYQKALGMNELRRENFTEERFTLVFMGYGDSPSSTLIELTYNWDENSYQQGTGYGHIALEVNDIYAICNYLETIDIKIIRPPGPMNYSAEGASQLEEIAFIEDPDGYKIEFIQA
jgi:lactoylglutathione lyase